MLASLLPKATRDFLRARPTRLEPLSLGFLALSLARGAAITVCLLGTPEAFAEEKGATPSSPKADAAKRSLKAPVREKARSLSPAPASPPAPPNAGAAEPSSSGRTPPRAAHEQNVMHEQTLGRAPLAPLPAPDTSTPPPHLPSASRERMHACAIEWSKLKLEAKNPMPSWREFGAQCLTR